jgi:uncharacterized protein
MAQAKGSKGNSGKGFGSMDEARQREIASRGGRASAQSDTSNRGFASMDKNKQREISSQGGKASQGGSSGRSQRSSGNSRKDQDRRDIKGDIETSQRDLNSLEEEDEVATREQASYSETDEDEDEGLGDGNIGRSTRSRGSDEEG